MTPLLTEDRYLNPIWLVRGFSGLSAILVALAEFLVKTGPFHDVCLGGALGLLIGLCVFSSGIKAVVLKNSPQPSDVHPYSIR
jgi:selenophosphate synthetase-related protein